MTQDDDDKVWLAGLEKEFSAIEGWKREKLLTVDDLKKDPVWEAGFSKVADDSKDFDFISKLHWKKPPLRFQEFVRPAKIKEIEEDGNPSIALTEFTLADSTILFGTCSPGDPTGLDYIDPRIITLGGHVRFWWDDRYDPRDPNEYFKLLGKKPSEVFPLKYRCLVPCKNGDRQSLHWNGRIADFLKT